MVTTVAFYDVVTTFTRPKKLSREPIQAGLGRQYSSVEEALINFHLLGLKFSNLCRGYSRVYQAADKIFHTSKGEKATYRDSLSLSLLDSKAQHLISLRSEYNKYCMFCSCGSIPFLTSSRLTLEDASWLASSLVWGGTDCAGLTTSMSRSN